MIPFLGNLVDWWYPATKDKYMQKAQCIIQQYGNYTIEALGVGLNGINTQGENIADNGGIKEAYQAYSKLTCCPTSTYIYSKVVNNRKKVNLV